MESVDELPPFIIMTRLSDVEYDQDMVYYVYRIHEIVKHLQTPLHEPIHDLELATLMEKLTSEDGLDILSKGPFFRSIKEDRNSELIQRPEPRYRNSVLRSCREIIRRYSTQGTNPPIVALAHELLTRLIAQ